MFPGELISVNAIIPIVFAIGACFLAIQATFELVSTVRDQQVVNRRLQFKDRFETTDEAMIELRKSRGLDKDGNLSMSLRWFNEMVVRSGLPFQPVRWFSMSAGAGGMAGAAYVYFVGSPWIGGAIAMIVFVVAPIVALKMAAGARMKKLSLQLSDALQIVCRSLEAGHPVTTAVALVAREMPDPIGSEFGMVADEVSYGMSLTQAVHRLAERTADPDVELFAATVRLQEKTGGNLCELLKANTTTIRERQTMRLRINAASAEGRMSAMILTAAPFIVVLAIHVLRPTFYGSVMHVPMVQMGFGAMLVWMGIGNLIMRRMINFKF